MLTSTFTRPLVLASVVAVAACSGDSADRGAAADSADRRDSASASARGGAAAADTARRIASIAGFNTPESVKYDADLDVYFVSNINGNPSSKDGNGYIARVKPDSAGASTVIDTLARGGQKGATLNAPKGMAIVGDTLWVADIDAVRGFNRRTGQPTRTIDLASMQATFLNDIASDGAGTIYITDTGIRFKADGSMGAPGKQRIFRVKAGEAPTIAIEGDSLRNPNGIAWDNANSRFIVGPFGDAPLMTWKPGDPAPATLAAGSGQYDGVEVLADGRVLASSWADSSIHVVTNGQMRTLVTGVAAPADIGYDTRRNRVLIPLFNGNAVEVWTIGPR
jgi:hypothetical protein